jgi:hypothetical protein
VNERLSPTKIAILKALCHANGPTDLVTIHRFVKDATGLTVHWRMIEIDLIEMQRDGQVLRTIRSVNFGLYAAFTITERGRALAIAEEARNVFSPSEAELKAMAAAADPIQVTMCNAIEPREPLTARLIVDEDELDLWWANLGMEEKADAFAGLSLRMHGGESYVYVEAGIPVEGAIGVGPKHPTAARNPDDTGKAVQG